MFAKNANPWVSIPTPRPKASIRLFCFPFAGGGASAYRSWASLFPAEVEVCGIQLPGREERFREPLLQHYQTLVAHACGGIQRLLDRPFAFFGHSMGAMVAFECARRLRRHGHQPAELFVSACHAPQLPLPRKPIHDLPDDQLLREVGRLGGTPAQVLENEELMELIRPVLRADLALHETYAYAEDPPLESPITAFAGTDDPVVRSEHIAPWGAQTTGPFTMKELAGGHFFIHHHARTVAHQIASRLATTSVPAPEHRTMVLPHEAVERRVEI
jgi:medium-chain acyl-[acyl-carrier-protein] hydrolase